MSTEADHRHRGNGRRPHRTAMGDAIDRDRKPAGRYGDLHRHSSGHHEPQGRVETADPKTLHLSGGLD